MHERDHSHAAPTRQATDHDDATSTHRHSTTLDAPTRPLASGLLMRKERDGNGVAAGAEHAVAGAASSSGASLDGTLMRKFESSLGTDLSSVRVHTGSESASAAQAVGARAYTVGQDIHFGAGQYDPSSAGGQHLIAHEVAHTVQQRGGSPTRQNKLEVSAPGDRHESEADRAADAMVAGKAATVTSLGGAVVSRHSTAYSSDQDLKQLPRAPKFTAADNAFAQMAAAVQASVKGEEAHVAAPASSFGGSTVNLIEARNHAESCAVYYGTNASSRWNPFGNNYAVYEKSAQADASWAITMLANVRVAGSATGSWVTLLNRSNANWGTLVKQAQSMSIEVKNKTVKNGLAGMADGKEHFEKGDQEINRVEVGGAGNAMGTAARELGLKAPDTTAYKKAMQAYSEARNEIAPEQQEIITTLIPTNIASINAKLKESTDEKEKWETVKEATGVFEKGLTVAFGGAAFVEGEVGALGTTEEGLAKPAPVDIKGIGEKAPGVFTKVIDFKLEAINKHIAQYNAGLKNYSDVKEAMALKAGVSRYKNGLVKLRDRGNAVEAERARMEAAFKEFGKSLDEAMIKKGKAKKGSTEHSDSAALLVALRDASASTQGAVDGLSSGGAADLPGLYAELAKHAGDRKEDQTAGGGRSDARSRVFAIENGRWTAANAAIASIKAQLANRQAQIAGLETEFLGQFAGATRGTDSIK